MANRDDGSSQVRRRGFAGTGVVVGLCVVGIAVAAQSDHVRGREATFESPGGVTETCVALTPMPGAVYTEDDRAAEQALCSIDLYAANVAVCPKLLSTSPGTFLYDLSGGPFTGRQAEFEEQVCPRGHVVVPEAQRPPAYFKVTMNGADTSATFSTASLLYYHFSRYLDGTVGVPVAVYRSIDRRQHEQRVTRRGLELSEGRSALRMNHAAWRELDAVEQRPEAYSAPDEIFTTDRERIHGALLHVDGRRYGSEVNGTRRSGWGDGQNRDFQRTAPYLALRVDAPLEDAIDAGLRVAREDEELRETLADASAAQMAFWMQDLTEIVWLDYVFSQQDRIGNIDFVHEWHWVEEGELRTRRAEGGEPPADLAGRNPVRLRRTRLNDNDAGGKRMYRNYAKRTGMLEGLRHFNPDTYRRIVGLADDLAAGGPLTDYVRGTFGLTDVQFEQLAGNAIESAEILRAACRAGELRFDLDPVAVLAGVASSAPSVDCERP